MGIADVDAAYMAALMNWRRQLLAIASAVLLAGAPAHLIAMCVAMDFHAPLPFMLAWLIGVALDLRIRRPVIFLSPRLALNLGLHTYIAACSVMPSSHGDGCHPVAIRPRPIRHTSRSTWRDAGTASSRAGFSCWFAS